MLTERVREPSSLAVVTLNERGQANYQFYRAADRAFDIDQMILSLPRELQLYQIGGFCAIEETDAQIWEQVARSALQKGAILSIDPNIRPSLVKDLPLINKDWKSTRLNSSHIPLSRMPSSA